MDENSRVSYVYKGGTRVFGRWVGGDEGFEEPPGNVTSAVIASGVTTIGGGAFFRCSSLTSVEIPSGVTTIGNSAFQSCSSLSAIDIPDSVTKVGSSAFMGCTLLDKVLKENSSYKSVEDLLRKCFDELPLHRLCYNNDASLTVDVIRKNLKTDIDAATKTDGFKRTALHLLVSHPEVDTELVDAILHHNSLSASMLDSDGKSPLHLICENTHSTTTASEIISHILKASKQSASMLDSDGKTPLHLICENAYSTATKEIIALLLKASPNLIKEVDGNQKIPLVLAIEANMNMSVIEILFACNPIDKVYFRNDEHIALLAEAARCYISNLASLPLDRNFSQKLLNGWVSFASTSGIINGLEGLVVDAIKKCPDIASVEILANSKDSEGRTAMDVAVAPIRKALEGRLLFLGRYEVNQGYPIHKSATSIIVKAYDLKADVEYRSIYQDAKKCDGTIAKHCLRGLLIGLDVDPDHDILNETMRQYDKDGDNVLSENEFVEFCNNYLDLGQKREIVLKFFSNNQQFQREIKSRDVTNFKREFVVQVLKTYDGTKDQQAISRLKHKQFEPSDYCAVMTMPFADRSLDAIFRSEMPSTQQIMVYAKQIMEAIRHTHLSEVIHGDIKLLNIVRIRGRLSLIDFDASSKLSTSENKSYIGAKFSSGVLPPEMIVELDEEGYKDVTAYFKKYVQLTDEEWEKIEPKTHDSEAYMVRTFKTKTVTEIKFGKSYKVEKPDLSEDLPLPYELVEANEKVDLWSFGVLLYMLVTESPLFKVTRDDNLKDVSEMKMLQFWSDDIKREKLKDVKDLITKDLLEKLLQKDPCDRLNATDVLNHSYFTRNDHQDASSTDMTGLLNQQKFEADKSEWELKAKTTLSAAFAIDIANFKELNDKTSHHEGDVALKIFAMQIKEVAEMIPGAKVYHSGGDEFQLLAHCQGIEVEFKKRVKHVAEKLSEIEHEKKRVECFLRIGVACFLNATYEQADSFEHNVKMAIIESRQIKDRQPAYGIKSEERYEVRFEPEEKKEEM